MLLGTDAVREESRSILHMMRRIVAGLAVTVERHRFALAAFLIPLTIRAIPEIIAGPYPIGFDTIASYLPTMLDWSSGNFSDLNRLFGGSLVLVLLGFTYTATKVDPVLILKITGPVLYGMLGSSEYFFARSTLKWDRRMSLLLTLIASSYFVSLRVSWDLFRNTLGLVILLSCLGVKENLGTRLRVFTFSGLVWLATITHLLVATLLFSILFLEMVRLPRLESRLTFYLIPGLVQYVFSVSQVYSQGVQFISIIVPSIQLAANYLSPIYIFLPLLPMAWIGRDLRRRRYVFYWLAICVIGFITGTTPISISSDLVNPNRWTLMMSFPVAILATNGYRKLRNEVSFRTHSLTGIRPIWLIILLILGVSYAVMPASYALPYFHWFTPTSMMQSSVPLEDSGHVVDALRWLSANIPPAAILMTHQAIYGWAREYFGAKNLIVVYGQQTTIADALQYTLAEGYTIIYTVWWTEGAGWYGEASVPTGFTLVHSDGRIGVYLYTASPHSAEKGLLPPKF